MHFAIAGSATAQVATNAEVSAVRLDGSTAVGRLQDWTLDRVVIATGDGPQPVPLEELLSLRWLSSRAVDNGLGGSAGNRAPQQHRPDEDGPAKWARAPVVELTDGSLLPVSDFRVAGDSATFSVAAPSSERQELSLPRRNISVVRFQALSPETAQQWQEIRQLNLPSDVLVLLKREGQSLDYVEGILGDVTDEKIEFRMDDEVIRVNRPRVAGLLYFRRDAQRGASTPAGHGIVHGRSGLRAVAARAALVGGDLRVQTAAGLKFAWPLADVYLVDYSAGKLVYLSDLKPVTERWVPLVGLPRSVAAAADYGRPRLDKSAFGGPLALWFPDDDKSATLAHERTYAKGLALRSRTELTYRLPAGYRRLVAAAGMDPATRAVGDVILTLRGDEQILWEGEIGGERPPQTIDLDIQGVRRLSIVVDYGRNFDHGDWLNLCDARIVK